MTAKTTREGVFRIFPIMFCRGGSLSQDRVSDALRYGGRETRKSLSLYRLSLMSPMSVSDQYRNFLGV